MGRIPDPAGSEGTLAGGRVRGAGDHWSWLEERLKRLDVPLGYEERLRRARSIAHQCRCRVEAHHPYTKEHSIRVARWSRVIGARLPTFDRERLDRLEITALVHDYGKIDIPQRILNKPGRLAPHEMAQVRRHPVAGAALLESFRDFVETEGVLYHHLRFGGGGYPEDAGLSGADICLEARIIAVADTFDAITSDRSYRRKRRPTEAIEVLREEAGRQLDPTLVRIFADYYQSETYRKGYQPGALTIELAATIDEEVRKALDFLHGEIGDFDMRAPLKRAAQPEALTERAVRHLVSLTCDRDCAEKFVRAAFRLPQPESFAAEDIISVEDGTRPLPGVHPGHRELTLRLRNMAERYAGLSIACHDGKLWKCVADGERMVLLR